MKKSYLTRLSPVLLIASVCMLLGEGVMASLGEIAVLVILAMAAVAAAVVAIGTMVARDKMSEADAVRIAGASYIAYAVIGIAFMATGFVAIGWGWIGVALVRAAVIFWAQDRVKKGVF